MTATWEEALSTVLLADGWECHHCSVGVGVHHESRADYYSVIAPPMGTPNRRRWDEHMRAEHGDELVAEVYRIQAVR